MRDLSLLERFLDDAYVAIATCMESHLEGTPLEFLMTIEGQYWTVMILCSGFVFGPILYKIVWGLIGEKVVAVLESMGVPLRDNGKKDEYIEDDSTVPKMKDHPRRLLPRIHVYRGNPPATQERAQNGFKTPQQVRGRDIQTNAAGFMPPLSSSAGHTPFPHHVPIAPRNRHRYTSQRTPRDISREHQGESHRARVHDPDKDPLSDAELERRTEEMRTRLFGGYSEIR